MFFVVIDDHARVALMLMLPDEKTTQEVQFLKVAVATYAKLGVKVKRLLTDNGSAFSLPAIRDVSNELGIVHLFTRSYRPKINGKAERLIQSSLREWA